jgi:hypothetical protein
MQLSSYHRMYQMDSLNVEELKMHNVQTTLRASEE